MRYRKYETDGFATPSGKCELWSGGLLLWRFRISSFEKGCLRKNLAC